MTARPWIAVLGLLILRPLQAQDVTGALEGRALGTMGEPVEGVQVTLEGSALQGIRVATTDPRGRFTLQSLPAGNYSVRIHRIGYGPIRIQDVSIRLGNTTSLGDLRLVPQAVEVAEVVVSGAKPVIDPVSTAAGGSIDSSRFLSLPAARDFRSLIPFFPQANASAFGDGANIGGSTGLENAFYVDGMNVTVGAGTSMDLPFNFVREIQVSTGGYEAEYGRALSGVVNVATLSGGNEFHGQVLGFFTGDQLRTTPRVGLGQADALTFSQFDVGASLSGPIRRDRLWYFVAYDPTYATQQALVAALPQERDRQVSHLLAGKLTWKAATGTDVVLTILGDRFNHQTVATDLLPSSTATEVALGRATGGGTTISVQARHEFDPRTELSVTASRSDRPSENGPRSGATSLGALTRLDDFTTNASSGGVGQFEKSHDARTAVRAAVTLQRQAHTLKVGAEYEDNAFADDLTASFLFRNADSVYDWVENFATSRVHNRVPTLFAQDAWEISQRLRLNAGLRWEAQHMSGREGPSRTVAMELAPRVGVVYELGEHGTQRLFAHAGRFFQQVTPFALTVWNETGVELIREYPQNPLVDSANGVVQAQFDFSAVPPTAGLVGQYYDQLSLGYERQIGGAFKAGLRGSYRILRWIIEDGVAPGDSVYRMGNPGRGPLAAMPRARQRYAALEVSVERSTPGPLYVLASYVLSRNIGNYTGLYDADLLYVGPNAGPQFDVPDLIINAYGPLPNDRTHVAKLAASYRTGFGAALGGFLTVASGTPLSEGGTSAFGYPYLTFVTPRGSAGRTPAIWSLDLHGAYDLPIAKGGRVRSRLLMDVFNVGSPRRAQLYEQRHYLDDLQTQVNPNYGAVTRYQAPMSARVGMMLDF